MRVPPQQNQFVKYDSGSVAEAVAIFEWVRSDFYRIGPDARSVHTRYAFPFRGVAMALSFSFLDMASTGALLFKRQDEAGGGSSMGCFIFLIIVGIVAFIIMKNRNSAPATGPVPAPGNRQGGGSGAAMPNFVNPYDKCPSCGAKGDKMKSTWDGMRKVQWTCGYCGTLAGVQELKDEELPASAKARLGIGQTPGAQNMMGGPGYPGSGSGVGGILTGMMLGSMLGGGNHHDHSGDGGFGSSGVGGTSSNSDWGESGGSGWGDSGSSDSSSSDSGGGWGDSGGGDSGGGDSGGGGDW